MRLQRFLALAGIASRRKSEDLIAAGLVAVNGQVVTLPGTRVDPSIDRVTVRGQPVAAPTIARETPHTATCWVLHKPRGVVTTTNDPGDAPTVYDYVREPSGGRAIYVGRLDRDTEGVLLFTTSGTLAHRLMHPRWSVARRYCVTVSGDTDVERLRAAAARGLKLEDGRTAPYAVLRADAHAGGWRIELELREGKNREVRRMIEACNGRVDRLVRTSYAFVDLAGLPVGTSRRLSPEEVQRLCALVELDSGAEE